MTDIKDEFENAAKNPGTQYVVQGYEEISFNTPQISRRFQQCNTFLLINPQDGTTLFKHAGPRGIEVVFGGEEGENFQDNYKLFMNHAQTHGQNIYVMPVYGSISRTREHLISQIEATGKEMDIQVNVQQPIMVPSTNWVWDILYNPEQAYAITKHYEGDNNPVYTKHVMPGVQPENFCDTADIARTLEAENNKNNFRDQIVEMLRFKKPQELEEILIQAQQSLGQDTLQTMLSSRFSDFKNTASDFCVWEFRRQVKGQRAIPPENTLECLEVLERFDHQDQACLRKYMLAILECMEETPPRHVQDLAADKLAAMKARSDNPGLIRHIECREEVARLSAARR